MGLSGPRLRVAVPASGHSWEVAPESPRPRKRSPAGHRAAGLRASRPCPPGDGSLIRLPRRPSARTLTAMHSWQSPSYVLEPPGTFTPDPGGCPHCAYQAVHVDDPVVQHRHWTLKRKDPAPGTPPEWQPNWAWRLAFRIWGEGDAPASGK